MVGLGDRLKCAAEDLYAEQQLGDKQYIRQQLDCVLSRGPCDDSGALIRSKFRPIGLGLGPLTPWGRQKKSVA